MNIKSAIFYLTPKFESNISQDWVNRIECRLKVVASAVNIMWPYLHYASFISTVLSFKRENKMSNTWFISIILLLPQTELPFLLTHYFLHALIWFVNPNTFWRSLLCADQYYIMQYNGRCKIKLIISVRSLGLTIIDNVTMGGQYYCFLKINLWAKEVMRFERKRKSIWIKKNLKSKLLHLNCFSSAIREYHLASCTSQ